MAIDLLEVQPHKVKAGLQGKQILIYGPAKIGKTTVACQFDKPILFGFEMGYGLIDGITAVPVQNWIEFKNYAKQLKKEEVREKFSTVIIDTVDLMWSSCEKFVKTQNDVEDLMDLAYGKGYRKVRDEFQDIIMSLGQLGYTIVFISHAEKKDYVDSMGVSHSGITPTLDKRPKEIITGLVDIMVYVGAESDSNGKNNSIGILRGGVYKDTEIEAGSRYGEGLPVKINWSYDELVKAVQSADESMVANGIEISKDNKTVLEEIKQQTETKEIKKRSFTEVYKDVTTTLDKLKERIVSGENELADSMTSIIEGYLGVGKRITEATPAQQDLIEEALADLKEL